MNEEQTSFTMSAKFFKTSEKNNVGSLIVVEYMVARETRYCWLIFHEFSFSRENHIRRESKYQGTRNTLRNKTWCNFLGNFAEFRNEAEASRLLAVGQLSNPYYIVTINIAIVDTRSCLENLTPRVPGTEAAE